MQDNTTPHTSETTAEYLKSRNIEVLDWAACSPDGYPIERIYERGKVDDNLQNLKAINEVWAELDIYLIEMAK